QKALIFHREGQKFTFTKDKSRRELMREAVGENQLFFSVACTMNDADCIAAMAWFREGVAFTQDYPELASLVMENFQDKSMLKSIADYAKEADVGIADMRFELKDQELPSDEPLPAEMPERLRAALTQFMQALSDASGNAEPRLKMGQLNVTSEHQGVNRGGEPQRYWLGLSDESDGTRRLMRLAPAMEAALQRGGLVVVDEIEENLHPLLLELLISKFQSKEVNKTGAQLVFSTHSSEVFDLLRKDQIYLVDKDPASGASELYSISEFDTRTTDNIRKGYLLGKYGAIPNVELPEVT
ncbi:MAG: AAA family ATPase, partial [bacterium]